MQQPLFNDTTIAMRLRELRIRQGNPSQAAFAKLLGLNSKTLSAYERGDRKPSRKALEAYSRLRGVTMDWLVSGEPSTHKNVAIDLEDGYSFAVEALTPVPLYGEITASAGAGASNANEQPTHLMAFSPQFLRDQGATPEHCVVIRARGESMKPSISDGSFLIVDRSQKSVEDGSIYVFDVSGHLVVKRAHWKLDNRLTLKSDNPSPAYADEVINAERADQLTVIGRVVFVASKA